MHVPEHTNNSSHRNYVDCVRFLGDLVLSKSTDNCISLWTPDEVTSSASESQSSSIIHLQDYKMENCNIWYVRFAIDTMNQNLYCGNIDGRIFVWDLSHVGSYAPSTFTAVSIGIFSYRFIIPPSCQRVCSLRSNSTAGRRKN